MTVEPIKPRLYQDVISRIGLIEKREGTMLRMIWLGAMLASCGSQALADDVEFQFDGNPPIRFHHAHPNTVIRQGTKAIEIQNGLTPLDRAGSVNCESASGCIVTAKVWVNFDGGTSYPTISAYIDGVAMKPASQQYTGVVETAQQSVLVAQGSHTLQSQVSQTISQGYALGWNAEYAVYDLK